jgi:hypothetical protein
MSDGFYADLPPFDSFEGALDTSNYRALPDNWYLALADVVRSTEAIGNGRYKAVNMAGASVIAALLNSLGEHDLPFVFGGDGALVAVGPDGRAVAESSLAAVQTWVAAELGLELRAALVPVSDIKAEGLDVRVARFRVNDDVAYAMFTGGGAAWAEAAMKAGRYRVAPAEPGTMPDLTGLSCRWRPIASRRGVILSIIVLPGAVRLRAEFDLLVQDIIRTMQRQDRGGHPIREEGPDFGPMPEGVTYERRTAQPGLGRYIAGAKIRAQFWLGALLDLLGVTLGGFDPKLYRRDVAQNSDFRKFDDGLKMTVDVDTAQGLEIERKLAAAAARGVCRYGLHRQDSALITCLVPTPLSRDHMHFIDGAAGGYAMAALQLKQAAAPPQAD